MKPHRPRRSRKNSGQAAVEAALTLPLVVFLILGTLQLFLVLQARIVAQYAVYKAVRSGSLNHGKCGPIRDAAIASVLPTITRTDSAARLGNAFGNYRNNRFQDGSPVHNGPIVELVRQRPTRPSLQPSQVLEDNAFDQPNTLRRLEVRMLYWYRLDIPFANWVISRMVLAGQGLQPAPNASPIQMTDVNPDWDGAQPIPTNSWPGGSVTGRMVTWSNNRIYMLPIRVTSTMRMMTPPDLDEFQNPGCPI